MTDERLLKAVHMRQHTFVWREHETYMNSFPHFLAPIKDDNGKAQCNSADFAPRPAGESHRVPAYSGQVTQSLIHQKLCLIIWLCHRCRGILSRHPNLVDIGFRIEDVAILFNKLAPSLGFRKDYIVQGGDVGSKVVWVMPAEHAACKAARINFFIMPEPSQPIGTIDELEARGLECAAAFSKTGSAPTLSNMPHAKHDCLRTCKQPNYLGVVDRRKFLDRTDEDPPTVVSTGCTTQAQGYRPGLVGPVL